MCHGPWTLDPGPSPDRRPLPQVVPHFENRIAEIHAAEDASSREAGLHPVQARRLRARQTAGLLRKYLNQREVGVLSRMVLRQAIVYETFMRTVPPPLPRPPPPPARPPTPVHLR